MNDQLVTREGTSVLVTLTREMYQDTVYTLAVGTPQELARAGQGSQTLFAGGLLMGDYNLQSELDAQRARPFGVKGNDEALASDDDALMQGPSR